ncbi:MAG: 1-acyl-sn-glycerol-3-phosphate acyltransferase, partial [Mesorhizobium sp.]
SGTFGAPQRSLWWQVLRLSLAGAGPQLKRLRRLLADVLYAGWWWIVVACSLLLAWLAVMLLPRLDWRWAAVRMIAHAALALAGVTITASGIEHISRRNAILAFNHSSYMDALVLAAGLPGEPAFVAKKELAGQVFAGPFLRRLSTLFVERYDVTGSLSDLKALTKIARQGQILVFFPEGTFTRRPGLSAFYLGAFKVAVDANLPVLPGIIRGTRSMLRGDQWFPRWTPVTIEIGAPIVPSGTDFESALRLRDAARQAILARCGEPDLGEMVKPTRPEAES